MPESNAQDAAASSDSSSSETTTTTIAKSLQKALTENEDDNANEAVPLGLYWDEWGRCVGSGYQLDSLYRNGKLDGCGKQWRDLKLAAEARLIQWRKPERAQELINSTYYTKRTTISPTAGAIWELKDKPGWN